MSKFMPKVFYKSEGLVLYQGDCLDILPTLSELSVDMIFADPPYNLSNGGITCQAGRMVSVNKGEWDKSQGADADHEFVLQWLTACRSASCDVLTITGPRLSAKGNSIPRNPATTFGCE